MSNRSTLPILDAVPGIGGSRRFLWIAMAALVVAAVWGVSRWASTPNYVTLFRDLELTDAASIEDKLQKNGISHRLSGGGTEIMVPAADVARARVALAKDGLPGNGRPGLELFDKPSWGMTDFAQRVTYQRALEGELARTIGAVKGVQRAQVHLVVPTPSPLRRLEQPASASVVLTLQPGATLSSETVQGITYVVSHSVEHLSSDNVAVMDDTGHLLSIPSGDGSPAGLTTWQLEIQRSVERRLADKIEELLGTVVGSGRVRAQVSAEMSFDQAERTVETYDPDGQVLQTEQRSEAEPGTSGEPGAQTIVNNSYQNSKKMERNVSTVGKLTRLTAAVLVDEKAMAQGAGAGGGNLSVSRLRAMVANAIGADSTRGDRLSVVPVPFEPLPVPGGGAAGTASDRPRFDPLQMFERVGRPVIGLLAIVALIVLGLRALRMSGGHAVTPGPGALAGVEGGETARLPGGAGPELTLLPGGAQHEPAGQNDTAARVVRAWLANS